MGKDVTIVTEESLSLSSMIADTSIPIDKFIKRILAFFDTPKCGQEPYAMLVRNALDAGKNGTTVNTTKWLDVFPRLETILHKINRKGSLFAKVILNESMGHRYVDYWVQTGDSVYEQKMLACYKKSYDDAIAANLIKNIDSTMFWLALAYHRMGNFAEAKKYYKVVADRKGERFVSRLFRAKIVWSMVYALPEVTLPTIKDVSDVYAKGNDELRAIYQKLKNTVYWVR